jgi:hypothetical protein
MGSPIRAIANSPLIAGLVVGALMLAPSGAAAQDSKASAEELFQLGKAAMAKNDLTKACAYFQGSLNADFALGTLLNLGICLEQAGTLASAWGAFRSLEDKARQAGPTQAERARYAHDRAELLRPRLSRLRIVLSPEAKAVNGLTVKIDGVVAQPELFEVGVPVDPGTRGVVVSAPAHDDWNETVTVAGEKQKLDLTVPGLKLSPVMAPPVAPAPPPPPPSSTRTVGFVIGGIGAASLVAGGVFGLLALGASKDSKCDGCIDGSDELTNAKAAYSRANAFAWVTNIALGVGVVGLGVGTALVLTSGSGAKKRTAQLLLSPSGVGIGGTL